jgi:hypothetical protein
MNRTDDIVDYVHKMRATSKKLRADIEHNFTNVRQYLLMDAHQISMGRRLDLLNEVGMLEHLYYFGNNTADETWDLILQLYRKVREK